MGLGVVGVVVYHGLYGGQGRGIRGEQYGQVGGKFGNGGVYSFLHIQEGGVGRVYMDVVGRVGVVLRTWIRGGGGGTFDGVTTIFSRRELDGGAMGYVVQGPGVGSYSGYEQCAR